MMGLLIVTSGRLTMHQPPPGHPERPERHDAMHAVATQWLQAGATRLDPEPATAEQLRRVHTEPYLARLASTAGRAVMLDSDTFTSPESWEIARLAAGAAIGATGAVLDGKTTRAAALVRPPGHHAEPGRAMGFCLINNAAVAAADAIARGIPRVAIVDFDVHHGNGTQAAFAGDPRVLFVSTHQWPYYPGSGQEHETGTGDGEGFTVNVPLEAGATDADYDVVFRQIVVPIVTMFDPGLIIVSAGYDAHQLDPLAGMRMTEAGFALLTRHLVSIADQCCHGRLVLVTEGGYHLPSLAASLDASLGVMAGRPGPLDSAGLPEGQEGTGRGGACARRVRAVQSGYWRGL